jgi:hypothetical protein
MFVLAHADHPEMFVAGLVVGVALAVAHVAWRRLTGKK